MSLSVCVSLSLCLGEGVGRSLSVCECVFVSVGSRVSVCVCEFLSVYDLVALSLYCSDFVCMSVSLCVCVLSDVLCDFWWVCDPL